MKRHPLREVGDDFFTTAPVRTTSVIEVPVSPVELWAALAADDAVGSWSKLVTEAHWDDARREVGAVREVTIGGALTVREVFYRWDVNERMSFSASETTGPGIAAFAEDYVITSTPSGSRLAWTVAMEPSVSVPGPVGAVVGRGLGLAVAPLAKGLKRKLLAGG